MLKTNHRKKEALLSPIPPEVGMLKFTIVRKRTKFSFMQPSFYLQFDNSKGSKIPILYAKKLVKKSAYYLISLKKNKERTQGQEEVCLGKLRAIEGDHEKYVLYDAGENPTKANPKTDNIRQEHGTFIYRYEPCPVGNIRKMVILFPSLLSFKLSRPPDHLVC